MRSHNPLFKIIFLLTIYCFGVFVSAKSIDVSLTDSIVQPKDQKETISGVSPALFLHTQQSENILTSFSDYSFSGYKLPIEHFWTLSFSSELFFNAQFKQYKNNFKLILIRYRKADLIYPFHSFW